MRIRWVLTLLVTGAALAVPATLLAQWPGPPLPSGPPSKAQLAPKAKAKPAPRPQSPQVELDERDTLTPAQIERAQKGLEAPAKAAPKPAQPASVIACSGAFAKNSSHLKLATVYDSKNLTFAPVVGPEGSRPMASVLFAGDPKKRLEVWWDDEGGRNGTSLIVINGLSAWLAPKGLKLGMALAALEKLNGKPFKLSGLDANISTVTDWQGGALALLPGGCKVGVQLKSDAKTSAEAKSEVAGKKAYVSTDAAIRALKPIIAEILIGY